MILVEQGVDAVEAGEVAHRQVGGVHDGLVAVQVIEAGQVDLHGVERRRLLAGDGIGGEHLEGVVVELGELLPAVAPDHPPPVGVRARDEAAEVARAQPGVLALVVAEDEVAVRPGAGEGGVVLLVAAPVGDRVLGFGEERVSGSGAHGVLGRPAQAAGAVPAMPTRWTMRRPTKSNRA